MAKEPKESLQVKMHYAVFNDVLGIFLGCDANHDPIWSKSIGIPLPPGAPTFPSEEVWEEYKKNVLRGRYISPTRFVEIRPDMPDNFASPQAAAGVILPAWLPTPNYTALATPDAHPGKPQTRDSNYQ